MQQKIANGKMCYSKAVHPLYDTRARLHEILFCTIVFAMESSNIPTAFRVDNEWLTSKSTDVHSTLYVQSFVCLDLSGSREAAFPVRPAPTTVTTHTPHHNTKTAQHKTVKQA